VTAAAAAAAAATTTTAPSCVRRESTEASASESTSSAPESWSLDDRYQIHSGILPCPLTFFYPFSYFCSSFFWYVHVDLLLVYLDVMV
jgi:hypothetical protein